MRWREHRAGIALAASIAVHGLMLVWVSRQLGPTAAPARATVPVEVRIVRLPPQAAKVPTPATMARPEVKAQAGVKRASKARGAELSQPAAAENVLARPDSPVARSLAPSLSAGMAVGEGEGERPRGHTVRNDGSGPDAKAVAEYQAEQAGRRVQGWSADWLASARAQRGLVNPYFGEMKRAMEKEITQSPPALGRSAFKNLAQAGTAMAQELGAQVGRYGRSGNPFEGEDPDVADVQARYSPNMQAMLRDPLAQTPAGQIGAALAAAEPARRMIGGAQEALQLTALVEILQARDGKVRAAKMMKSSGNEAFDKGVMAAGPRAVERLPPPPREGPGLGTDPEQLRTLWEFQGRLKYRKKVQDIAKQSGLAAEALAAAASVATGAASFDETTGRLELVDLTNPTVEFTARLLRLY